MKTIIFYKNYFLNFYNKQNPQVQEKIEFVLDLIRNVDHIPAKFFKHIKGANGLYEIRIRVSNNIFRIICFFDKQQIIILLNSFQKKTQKTPQREIKSAIKLKNQYQEENNGPQKRD